jgi:hypothetical protein
VDGKANKKNGLEIILRSDRFSLFTKTERERDEWIGQIRKAISKYSSMQIDGDEDESEEDSTNKDKDKDNLSNKDNNNSNKKVNGEAPSPNRKDNNRKQNS